MRYRPPSSGFSLLEIVLVVSIIALLAAIVGLPFSKFRQAQALQNSANALVSILGEARTKTLAALDNTSYGVHIQSDQAILFTGTTYSPSASTNMTLLFEEPVTAQTISLAGGGSEVKFDRLKGTTDQHGTIVIALPNGQTRTITISATGTITRN